MAHPPPDPVDRHCVPNTPTSKVASPSVPRSSSFTRSKRFLTGEGLSARESFGVVDDSVTSHLFEAAKSQLMRLLEADYLTALKPAPPPPSLPTALLARVRAPCHVPPAPPPPRRRTLRALHAAQFAQEQSASSAVSHNNPPPTAAAHSHQSTSHTTHALAAPSIPPRPHVLSTDDSSSLESANETALKQISVANVPESESVTPCSSDAPLSPYAPTVDDRVCARAFLHDAQLNASTSQLGRRDSHAAYVAALTQRGEEQHEQRHGEPHFEDRRAAAIDQQYVVQQKFNDGSSPSRRRRLQRYGSFGNGLITRSRSFGRVGRLRSFGRKEKVSDRKDSEDHDHSSSTQQSGARGSISTASSRRQKRGVAAVAERKGVVRMQRAKSAPVSHWRKRVSKQLRGGNYNGQRTVSTEAAVNASSAAASTGEREQKEQPPASNNVSNGGGGASASASASARVKSVHFAGDSQVGCGVEARGAREHKQQQVDVHDDDMSRATDSIGRAQNENRRRLQQRDEFVTIERKIKQTRADGSTHVVIRRIKVRAEKVLDNGDVIICRRMKRAKEDGQGWEEMTIRQVISRRRRQEQPPGDGTDRAEGVTSKSDRSTPQPQRKDKHASWVRRTSSVPDVSTCTLNASVSPPTSATTAVTLRARAGEVHATESLARTLSCAVETAERSAARVQASRSTRRVHSAVRWRSRSGRAKSVSKGDGGAGGGASDTGENKGSQLARIWALQARVLSRRRARRRAKEHGADVVQHADL